VREGDVVAARDGLVGRVRSVSPHTAEVSLITDGSVKVACEVETGDGARASGILSGGGGLLSLKHLSGAGDFPPRATVLTSGRGGVFPKGLEVGALLDVHADAEGLVREGEVLPNVDFSTLEDVFIRRGK
jgi:rod shape-determining protein MreC